MLDSNNAALPELVNSLVLAESFNLKRVKKFIVKELYSSLKDIPVRNSEAFKKLPINLVKDILLPLNADEDEDDDEVEDADDYDEEDDEADYEEDDEDDEEKDEDDEVLPGNTDDEADYEEDDEEDEDED